MHCICLLMHRRRQFVLLFAIFALCYSHGEHKSDSVREEDWLRPYSRDHYDSKRTHRHVRSCQEIKHGNVTHETFPALNINLANNFQTRYFAKEMRDNNGKVVTALGHISFVSNPLRTFSVLEPLHVGSCNPWVAPRANVLTTSNKRCIVASNAGFFRPSSGGCIGNIFSNGRLVQTSNGIQNANFGIRKDGSIVTGYLTEDNVRNSKNPFVQLVSGVGWLLRDGQIYTNISIKAECADSEETGSIQRFFGVISARTAVGHDKFGRVVIVHVDGKTDKRGLNLYSFAELLKSFGIVNAINLDGGGSTTFATNGSIVNYPSDKCEHDFVCARRVSTILCFHEPECSPLKNCSGHGFCQNGACICHPRWKGLSCNVSTIPTTSSKDETVKMANSSKVENNNSMNSSIVWSVGLAAFLGASLIANVCLVNLYLAMSWRQRSISQRKEDLQRLLVGENEDL